MAIGVTVPIIVGVITMLIILMVNSRYDISIQAENNSVMDFHGVESSIR